MYPDRILERLGDLNATAQQFIRRANQNARRQDISRLLNAALDPATSRLLRLRGDSLNELFVDVRRQLHAEGKEWVLLLEDLTALTGIRGALFDLMVRGNDAEDLVEGRPLCTIRTVLAVTPRYLSGQAWDTIRTRAELLWEIEPNEPDEKSDVDRAIGFIGSYLNAARRGVDGLAEDFVQREGDDSVLAFQGELMKADTQHQLNAFEYSREGYPLFPLNRNAVRQLLRSSYKSGAGTLRFTPRDLIGRLLRVLNLRADFEKGEFPSKAFGESPLRDPVLLKVILDHGDDPSYVDRYQRLLAYWGDQPSNAGEAARLDHAIPEAFNLEPIDFGAPASVVVAPVPLAKLGVPVPPVEVRRNPLANWKETLIGWRTRERTLTQHDARQIRSAVAECLAPVLPVGWPGLPSTPDRLDRLKESVYLPRVGTGITKPDDAAIVVCSDTDLDDHRQHTEVTFDLLTVLAVHDLEVELGKLSDLGEDVSLARYANFVTRHAAGLAKWVRNRETLKNETGLRTLGHGLTCASLLLRHGVSRSRRDRILALFTNIDTPAEVDTEWGKLTEAANLLRIQAMPQLAASFYSYQGRGKKPQALDAADLLPLVSGALPTGDALERSAVQHVDLSMALKVLRRRWKLGVPERRKALQAWRANVGPLVTPGLIDELNQLVDAARGANMHLAPDGADPTGPLLDSLEELPTFGLDKVLGRLSGTDEDSDWEEEIATLADVDADLIVDTGRIVARAEAFVAVVKPAVEQRLATIPTSEDTEAAMANLRGTLGELRSMVEGGGQ